MELEDFAEGPVGVAVAASAVVFSPRVRRVVRRGLVYGVAGVLAARDSVAGFVRGVRRTSGDGAAAEDPEGGEPGEPARAPTRAPAAREGRRAPIRDRDPGE
jgi:hypothetical protein